MVSRDPPDRSGVAALVDSARGDLVSTLYVLRGQLDRYGDLLEVLGHELEPHVGILRVGEQHPDVILIARQTIERVGEHDVALAVAHRATQFGDPGPVERGADRGVANRTDDRPVGLLVIESEGAGATSDDDDRN